MPFNNKRVSPLLSLLLVPFFFVPALAAPSAFGQLALQPAASAVLDSFAAPEPALTPLLSGTKAVQPGASILPVIEDQGRVDAILRLAALISRGGPYPFKQDNTIFRNKEGLLPAMPPGFYREYTLIVPKDSSRQLVIGGVLYNLPPSYGVRGVERLVVGGDEIVYYSPTHYADFIRLTILP